MNFSTRYRAVQGQAPVADALAGTKYSDIVKCDGGKVVFIIQRGVGTTGKSVITVEACDDNSPSNVAAVEFDYKEITAADGEGALTHASSSGYTMTAGSSRIDVIEVDAARLAEQGYGYCRLKAVEATDSAVLAGNFNPGRKAQSRRRPDGLPALVIARRFMRWNGAGSHVSAPFRSFMNYKSQ